ncbi:hypothetical protein D9758_000952 [Tetrapyrgos nigripes]|uniref:Ndc10 domain-containing protein n=1 Tax=Tetrapyrgos nigripes TaxID=182062 RepID=A0A8H5GZF8_9AGAR|nr:hypothetical protein D9758_000952 [Tetrapyrgos nigripes]
MSGSPTTRWLFSPTLISSASRSTQSSGISEASTQTVSLKPTTDDNGNLETAEEYAARLINVFNTKKLLREVCKKLELQSSHNENLEGLKLKIVKKWYPDWLPPPPLSSKAARKPRTVKRLVNASSASSLGSTQSIPAPGLSPQPLQNPSTDSTPVRSKSNSRKQKRNSNAVESSPGSEYADVDEERLLQDLSGNVELTNEDFHAVLGVSRDDSDSEDDEDGADDNGYTDDEDCDDESDHERYRKRVRINADTAFQGHRRLGGKQAQAQIVRSFNKFLDESLFAGKILDRIVDEHSLLLFIDWTFDRPKLSSRGIELPGTHVGAGQIRKMFFGALRIRKSQEAENPHLSLTRPAVTVRVYDLLKTRISQAWERLRNGSIDNMDMPDIVSNTFLDKISDEQMNDVNWAFLKHRETRRAIVGHAAWTCQNASGNRGDDLRALRLRELQPWDTVHPTQGIPMNGMVGLQGEQKVKKHSMVSVNNPVYTAFINHRDPEWCPMVSLALLMHWLFDVYDIITKQKIDWTVNKSWGLIRLIFGDDPTVTYNPHNLYNLFSHTFKSVGLESRMKLHLPRHMLGYRQQNMGVDPSQTAKLGWNRQGVYQDIYAPSIPKTAVLAAHGFRDYEEYSMPWRQVHVPDQFLRLVMPMAEGILAEGTAAMYQELPESSIFKLPALSDPVIRNWMSTTFKTEYTILKAQAGSNIDLSRIQDAVIRESITGTNSRISQMTTQLTALSSILDRRTAHFSPTKGMGWSTETYYNRYSSALPGSSSSPAAVYLPLPELPSLTLAPSTPYNPYLSLPTPDTSISPSSDPSLTQLHQSPTSSSLPLAVVASPHLNSTTTPMYSSPTSSSLPLSVVTSPHLNSTATPICSSPTLTPAPNPPKLSTLTPARNQSTGNLELVLPDLPAFLKPGQSGEVFPAIFGQQVVLWSDVLEAIKRPEHVWDKWGTRGLDQYKTVWGIWEAYNKGEKVFNDEGQPIKKRKSWERFREIPTWIENRLKDGMTLEVVVSNLERMRTDAVQGKGKGKMSLNMLSKHIHKLNSTEAARKNAEAALVTPTSTTPPGSPSRPSDAPYANNTLDGSLIEPKKKKPRERPVFVRPRAKKYKPHVAK